MGRWEMGTLQTKMVGGLESRRRGAWARSEGGHSVLSLVCYFTKPLVYIKVTLDQTMRDNILGVAERGCSGLTEIVVRRKKEIEEIEEELDTLTETLEVLELRTK